jgi:hypothetical protein
MLERAGKQLTEHKLEQLMLLFVILLDPYKYETGLAS